MVLLLFVVDPHVKSVNLVAKLLDLLVRGLLLGVNILF